MKKTIFIKNAAILTASSLFLRFAGIIFKVWLAAAIGSEGIGLYQLVFSVYMLAATFAAAGICTAVTRLVADEAALGSAAGIRQIMKKSIQIILTIAVFSALLLFFGAEFISKRILYDQRAALSIKILAFSLPFMGISSCMRGYFIARRKATPSAVSQLIEQIIRIFLSLMLIKRFIHMGVAFTCGAVLLGDTAAEAVACIYLNILYKKDLKRLEGLSGREKPPYKITEAIRHIALPITTGRYLNTSLRTAENILVPKCLAAYSFSSENALSQFGMIKGMALPVLFFPSTLLNSLSTLLIPEISEASAMGRWAIVKSASTRILQITSLISFIFAAVFLIGGEKIGILIYNSADVGFLLKALSPIVPLMYLDSVSDGILKGLDQQLFTFKNSLFDSLIRIVLVIAVLPKAGLMGFIWIMYFSNLLTCLLNVGRLIKVSECSLKPIKTVFFPICSALTITLVFDTVLKLFGGLPNLVYIILLCGFCIPSYIALLFAFGSVSRDDILDVIR